MREWMGLDWQGAWTQEQWMVVAILLFIIAAVVILVFRLFSVLRMVTRKKEPPDLRFTRRFRR